MCDTFEIKGSFFLDLFLEKSWGLMKIIFKKNLKSKNFFLKIKNARHFFYKLRIKDKPNFFHAYSQKKTADIFDLFQKKFNLIEKELILEESKRIRKIKKKGKASLFFFSEKNRSINNTKLSLIFSTFLDPKEKIKKKKKSGKNNNLANCYFLFTSFPQYKNFDGISAKTFFFPKNNILEIEKINYKKSFFSKISFVLFSFSHRFVNFIKSIRNLYPRALIIKNKFFFFALFFLKKNYESIFKIGKNLFEYFFFLSQTKKGSLCFFHFSLKLPKKKKKNSGNYTTKFIKIISNFSFFLSNMKSEPIFQSIRIIFSSLFNLFTIFFFILKKKKIQIVGEKFSKKFVKKKSEKAKWILSKILLNNFDFFNIQNLIWDHKRNNLFSGLSDSRFGIFFFVNPYLNSLFCKKKKNFNLRIKIEKKKKKLELGLHFKNYQNGIFFPLHILSNNRAKWIVWLQLRFEFHFIELNWGNKKLPSSNYFYVLPPFILYDKRFFEIKIGYEFSEWKVFLPRAKNSFFTKYIFNLFLMNLSDFKFSESYFFFKNISFDFLKELFWCLSSENLGMTDFQLIFISKTKTKVVEFFKKGRAIFSLFKDTRYKNQNFSFCEETTENFEIIHFFRIILRKISFFFNYHYFLIV